MENILASKLQLLGDLDLAVLVSLITNEHCIFSIEDGSQHGLQEEIRLICTESFALQTVVVNCSARTTLDEFSEAVLVDVLDDYEDTYHGRNLSVDQRLVDDTRGRRHHSPGSARRLLDDRRVADVIIAVNLDLTSHMLQMQVLELLRTYRIFTRTAMHTAPKDLFFMAVSSKPGARLAHHLNDMFAMSHTHTLDGRLTHLENRHDRLQFPAFFPSDMKKLRELARTAHFSPEVISYLHNIVIFMRMSRYTRGGVSARATRQLRTLSQALAPLHGLDYVPPSLVELACKKIYPHRLILATAETERSLQWGSDPEAVRQALEGMTIDSALNEVLASVETPL